MEVACDGFFSFVWLACFKEKLERNWKQYAPVYQVEKIVDELCIHPGKMAAVNHTVR